VLLKGLKRNLKSPESDSGQIFRGCTQAHLGVLSSHPLSDSKGIRVDIEKQTLITVRGIDKQQVGTVAAKLRSIKPPEPYKGKEYAISESGFARRLKD